MKKTLATSAGFNTPKGEGFEVFTGNKSSKLSFEISKDGKVKFPQGLSSDDDVMKAIADLRKEIKSLKKKAEKTDDTFKSLFPIGSIFLTMQTEEEFKNSSISKLGKWIKDENLTGRFLRIAKDDREIGSHRNQSMDFKALRDELEKTKVNVYSGGYQQEIDVNITNPVYNSNLSNREGYTLKDLVKKGQADEKPDYWAQSDTAFWGWGTNLQTAWTVSRGLPSEKVEQVKAGNEESELNATRLMFSEAEKNKLKVPEDGEKYRQRISSHIRYSAHLKPDRSKDEPSAVQPESFTINAFRRVG